jgi:hypothetical protein
MPEIRPARRTIRPVVAALTLAVPNLASVAPLLASKLSSSFSALLNSHSIVTPHLDVFRFWPMAITIYPALLESATPHGIQGKPPNCRTAS